jgi:hypothetical protein
MGRIFLNKNNWKYHAKELLGALMMGALFLCLALTPLLSK